jgi:hypothetical protein
VSRPIANNLQPSLGQLDDFACRQLDRLGRSPSEATPPDLPPTPTSRGPSNGKAGASVSNSGHGLDSATPHGTGTETRSYFENRQSGDMEDVSEAATPGAEQAVAITPGGRSRWQTVLLEAGGLGAAVSEESLKSLRYCLQWLLVSAQSPSFGCAAGR